MATPNKARARGRSSPPVEPQPQVYRRSQAVAPELPLPDVASNIAMSNVDYLLRRRVESLVHGLSRDLSLALNTEGTSDVIAYLVLNVELVAKLETVRAALLKRLSR
jgi:hypothetical protein